MNQNIYLLLLSLSEIIGDFAFKSFANTGTAFSFIIGSAGYVGVVAFLILSLRGSTVLLVNSLWDGISAILESVAAFIFLKERFENIWQYIGLLLIISGLFLIRYKEITHK